MRFLTGWYGLPGSQRTTDFNGQVHVAFASDKVPLCGTSLRRKMAFQWCANGIHLDYVTCGVCKLVLGSKSFKERYGNGAQNTDQK